MSNHLGRTSQMSIVQISSINSLSPGGCGSNFKSAISEHMSRIKFLNILCEMAIMWMPQNTSPDKSTLVRVTAWCRKATSQYQSYCWPRFMSPYCILCHCTNHPHHHPPTPPHPTSPHHPHLNHDYNMTWKTFAHYWPFEKMDSGHKGLGMRLLYVFLQYFKIGRWRSAQHRLQNVSWMKITHFVDTDVRNYT